jgi:hypothetical protein
MYVTASTSTNFAGLPTTAGHTPVVYITASYDSSIAYSVIYGSGAWASFTLSGSALTAGVTYTLFYTHNGVTIPANPVTAIANGSEGEIIAPTPFSNLSLGDDDIIGIIVAR